MMNMNRLRLATIVLVVASAACQSSRREESITFYDDMLFQEVMQELNRSEIKFKVEGNQIWYSVEDRDNVRIVQRRVEANRQLPYTFPTARERDEFVERLRGASIEAATLERDGQYIALVRANHQEKAGQLFRSFIQASPTPTAPNR